MSIIVRSLFQGKLSLIGDDRIINGPGLNAGKNLARALPGGQVAYHEFGGVMDHTEPVPSAKKVKLVFLVGFQWELTEKATNIPPNSFTVGYLFNEKLYVAIKDNKPLFWAI